MHAPMEISFNFSFFSVSLSYTLRLFAFLSIITVIQNKWIPHSSAFYIYFFSFLFTVSSHCVFVVCHWRYLPKMILFSLFFISYYLLRSFNVCCYFSYFGYFFVRSIVRSLVKFHTIGLNVNVSLRWEKGQTV